MLAVALDGSAAALNCGHRRAVAKDGARDGLDNVPWDDAGRRALAARGLRDHHGALGIGGGIDHDALGGAGGGELGEELRRRRMLRGELAPVGLDGCGERGRGNAEGHAVSGAAGVCRALRDAGEASQGEGVAARTHPF